ncbi:primase-helicase family protein [Buttiauxella gaviniae]|uniref:primase-helicase family protein n=1 Tax=Buttiauxella gaviniae TaxID=82990 RepID=UPI0039AEF9C2
MTAPLTAVETVSDALFSCVYLWAHGRPYTRTDLDKAIHHHKDTTTTYGKLVVKLSQLHSMTYEDLCDAGYLGGDTEQVIALRRSVLVEEVGEEELNAWLRDSVRIHKVFPQDNTVVPLPVKKGQRKPGSGEELGDGTRINDEDRQKLDSLNATYTHVLAFGDHHVVSMKANPVTGETHAFQTLNSFRNNFLDTGRVAGRRLGGAWLEWPGHAKKLDGVGFYPNIQRCPDGVYNLFTGLSVQPVEGDVSPYLDHLRLVICAGDEESYSYLVGWLAHMFQKPDEKPSVAVVMKSIEGTGKGSMVRPLLEILGMYGIQVNGPGQIAGRFNGTIANKLFVFIDEAELTDARCADRLKALISEPTINLERKGKDPEPMPNYARFVFASNHDRVIRAGLRERRYLVLEPDGTRAQDKGYFDRLHNWIDSGGASRLLAYLMNIDLRNFDPRRPPVTAALIEEKLSSLPPAYQYLYGELWGGKPFNGQERVFAGELVDKFMLWCESNGESVQPAAARSSLGKVMSHLGFEVAGRSDRGEGKFYEVPDIDVMKNNFAAVLGEKSERVFT